MHTILNQNLEKYLEGRLPAEIRTSLETHLSQCRSCRAELDEMIENRRLLSVFSFSEDDPALEPMPGFSVKVLASIAAAPAPMPWWRTLLQNVPVRQATFAAALLAVVSSGYAFTLKTASPSPTAELLVDVPTYRQAPATLFVHHHAEHRHDAICMQCWRNSKVASAASDNHAVREEALASLVSEAE